MARPRTQRSDREAATNKAVIYCRVSTTEQAEEGYSIDSQVRTLEDFACKHGFDIVERFIEAQSASKQGRQKFAAMIRHLEQNPGTCVLVDKTDRLTRNARDLGLVEEMIKDYSAQFIIVRENRSIDRNTRSADYFTFDIMATVARHFIRNLREEVTKGMTEKARHGIFPSNAPIGYMNVNRQGVKLIELDSERAPLVRRLFEEYGKGLSSVTDLCKLARNTGLRTRKGHVLANSSIHRILSNPAYYGKVKWGTVEVPGQHEPIISEQLFRKCQDVMHGRASDSSGFGAIDFSYRGLFKCGLCGCNMTAELKKKRYVYYHCTGRRGPCDGKRVIREEEITAQIADSLKSLMIPDQVFEPLKEALKEALRHESDFREDTVTRQAKRESELKSKKAALYDHFADGLIDRETYDLKRQALDSELQGIRSALSAMDRAESNLYQDGVTLLELARGASQTFLEAKGSDRREILSALGSNSTIKDGIVSLNLREPFATIWQLSQSARFEHSVEPEQNVWYSRRDSNPRSSP